jgi:TolA-binding protein
MRHSSPKRAGRFLHVVLGMVVGVAMMSVVSAIVAGISFRLARERDRAERAALKQTIGELQFQIDEMKQRAAIDQQLNDVRREAEKIRAEINSRNERIRQLQRGLNSGGSVAGRVIKVEGEFATINIGGDDGLESGQTLYVYRSILLQKYVGTLKLLKVDAEQSVALFTPSGPGMEVQLGDIAGARTTPK